MQAVTCIPGGATLTPSMLSTDDRILHAAIRVFEEVGFRAATTRRIASEAGVNEVTLFRRFGSKEHLLLRAMRCRSDPLPPLPDVPADARAELSAWAGVQLRRLYRARVLIRTSMCELDAHPDLTHSAHEPVVCVRADLAAYLGRLREHGLAAGDWDPKTAAAMLMGTLFADAISLGVMPDHHRHDPEVAATQYVDLFLRAIGAAP
jgi:AcrR family transcriptional regulator